MTTTKIAVGPLAPSAKGRATYRPAVRGAITGGLWAERRRINRETSLLAGWDQLVAAGNIHDLELAAGRATGEYANDRLPFMDSDVYKWAETAAWALANPETSPALASELTSLLAKLTELLQAAQAEDGYLDSYFQVKHPGERFAQLAWGHELYCAGHLIQAAVALRRTTGDTGLLTIATRLADLISKTFGLGPSQKDGICGHPEIETALVELFRETGEQRYLDTALFFVDRRGHGLLSDGHFALYYFQDRTPVRDAVVVEGHAVRQLYLLAGVADLAVETEDPQLLAAAERLWTDMVATKTYLTGGIGAHHKDESFGAPYELPNERSYCETCAAIASIQFSWRMLAVTGEAKYADLIERTLYNGFLAGVSLDGQRYIYANPLQVRDGQTVRGDDGDYERVPWFHCACCPTQCDAVARLARALRRLGAARTRPVAPIPPGPVHRRRQRWRGHSRGCHRLPIRWTDNGEGGPRHHRGTMGSCAAGTRLGKQCQRDAERTGRRDCHRGRLADAEQYLGQRRRSDPRTGHAPKVHHGRSEGRRSTRRRRVGTGTAGLLRGIRRQRRPSTRPDRHRHECRTRDYPCRSCAWRHPRDRSRRRSACAWLKGVVALPPKCCQRSDRWRSPPDRHPVLRMGESTTRCDAGLDPVQMVRSRLSADSERLKRAVCATGTLPAVAAIILRESSRFVAGEGAGDTIGPEPPTQHARV